MVFGNSNDVQQHVKVPLIWLALLFCTFAFSQSLEDKIYDATEVFRSSKQSDKLELLNTEISTFEPFLKSEDEYFAFINLLINKAYYLSNQNENNDAISTYEKAYEIYLKNKVFSYDIVEYCLIPLGVLYHKSNAYVKAENTIKLYLALAKKHSNIEQQISGGINLALLYQSLNKHKSTAKIVDQTLKITGLPKEKKLRLEAIKKQSLLLSQSSTKDQSFITTDNSTESLTINYQLALKNKNYHKAINILKRITLINTDKAPRTLVKYHLQEAQLQYLLDKPDIAIKKLDKCVGLLLPINKSSKEVEYSQLYPENLLIDVFDLYGEIETDPHYKLHYYDLSFYVSSLLEYESTSEENIIINASANRNRSEKCIETLYQTYKKNRDISLLEKAISYTEKHKALVLKQNFLRKQRLRKLGDQNNIFKRQDSLLRVQKKFSNSLLNTTNINEQNDLRLLLTSTGLALKKLQKEIDSKYERLEINDISAEALFLKLKTEKTTLIEYFYGKKAIYQIVLSGKQKTINRIKVDDKLTSTLKKFIHFFDEPNTINTNISEFSEIAFSVYKLLNFGAVANAKRVIVIPDGIINFIPFETLLTNSTSTHLFSKMPFVVNSQAIGYNSSIVFYLNNKNERGADDLLGIFPVFEDSNYALNQSIEEAKKIKKLMHSTIVMRQDATKQAFLDKAKDFSVLHLSTHAYPGDFINDASIVFNDDTIKLNELHYLNLNPKLVVLSACETGVGKLLKGEGVMSLASGFQYIGAENILFSLWQVNDLSTAQIIPNFYEQYAKGKSALFSNQHSKINYLKNKKISNAKKSPYYWGAFVLYGDLKEINASSISIYYYVITIFALVLIVYFVRKIHH